VALAHHKAVLGHFSGGVLWGSLGPGGEPGCILAQWAARLGEDISRLVETEERRQAVQRLIGPQKLLLALDDAWEVPAAQALRCGGPNYVHLLSSICPPRRLAPSAPTIRANIVVECNSTPETGNTLKRVKIVSPKQPRYPYRAGANAV